MDGPAESLQMEHCSLLSLRAGETLYGTASQAEVFFMLEYNGVWGAKAFVESHLPPEVKAWFDRQLEAIPNSKLLLIKNRISARQPGIRFFVAAVKERSPTLYDFRLELYEELPDLDLAAVLSGSPGYLRQQVQEPMFLVCTNGRRDLCCAKFGLPVYAELVWRDAVHVWESTHMGGHRFATNMLCFPHGVLYGRVHPEEAAALAERYQAGSLGLDHYRGRSCYSKVVQAAEYHLRRQAGALGLDDFCLERADEIGTGLWQISFVAAAGGVHRLRLSVQRGPEKVQSGCQSDKLEDLVRYTLIDYSVEEVF